MSFSSDVKDELVKKEYESECCYKSLLYGMAIFGKSFSENEISFQTENENIADLFIELLQKKCNVIAEKSKTPKGKITTATVSDKTECRKIRAYFGHEPREFSLKINFSNFTCTECEKAFSAGAFLASGTISSPKKDYHLEFTIPYHNLSKDFFTLLTELEVNPKITNRKGYSIIYLKESEAIEDCLYIMGASGSMFEMMNIEIVKDFRNKANRQANCEAANIERMVKAVAPQIKAIEKIKAQKGLEYLKKDLQDIAVLRLENPDSSLQELAELSNPPLSRSGINHRLKRIVEIAEEL